MAIIMRVGGGGGGGLDLTVVGGTTQPENPKNNTLWINTDVAFEEVHLGPTQPILHSTTKNLFCCPLPSQSTTYFTFREDGGVDGTFAANDSKNILISPTSKLFWLKAGTYTISGSAADLATGVSSIGVYDVEAATVIAESVDGQPAVFTLEAETNVYVKISYTGNEDASEDTITVTVYPQIEEGETATEFVKGVRPNAVWVNTSNRYQSDASAVASTTHVLDVAEDPFLRINVLQFKQWDGTAWVWRDGGIYANNAWTDMALYIYWYGTVNESVPLIYHQYFSGNGNAYALEPTYNDDNFSFSTNSSLRWAAVYPNGTPKIDVTGFTTVGAKIKVSSVVTKWLKIGFSNSDGGYMTGRFMISASNWLNAQSTVLEQSTTGTEYSVPITCDDAEVYPVISWGDDSGSSSAARTVTVYYWVLT